MALAKITYTKPHLLLLDEPTNHLDLDTVRATISCASAGSPAADVGAVRPGRGGGGGGRHRGRQVQALIRGLASFNGAVFVISHDEHMITAVCDELWVVEPGRVFSFNGDFEDYKNLIRKKQKL